jgi:hypothetical protein
MAFGASATLSGLVALPALPVTMLAATPIAEINQATSDQIGWPAYVQQVADVQRGLPPDQATRAVIITANYGEAGALDRFGGPYDLPAVFSGHNELWFRGQPPADADVVIAVGFSEGSLDGAFDTCRVAATLDNGVDIPNEEQQLSVLVCRGPTRAWDDLWPSFQHYD